MSQIESPRRQAKRQKILQVATELFLTEGYAGVSVDGLISRIGGSKRTFYAYFGSKDGLFAAIIAQLCEDIVNPLTHIDLKRKPLYEALSTIAAVFLEVVLAPRTLALHRLVVSEAPRAPEAARAFFEAAPNTAYRCLTEYFAWADSAGSITPGDAKRRAVIFLDALTGDLQLRCLLGLLESPSPAERQHLVEEAIAIFTKGLTPHAG